MCNRCADVWLHGAAGSIEVAEAAQSATRITLEWASDVTPERIEWLWRDRLPLHDLAVLAGEPGLGKSTTTTELAARITRGELEGALHGKPHTVLIATAEDHFASVVWGRLVAAVADMDRVANVKVADGDLLTIPGDVNELARVCRQLRDEGRPAALIVVDPISAYLGGVDSHKDAAVRGALAPLAALAQAEQVCVLTVAHLNKSSAGKLLDRISGSGAFGAAPRSVLAFARDPDDEDGEQGNRRVIVHAKSNHGRYAPTLAGHIDAPTVEEVGSTVSRLVIDGETDVSPEDLGSNAAADESSGEDVQEALCDALASGERLAREVKKQVSAECHVSTKTIERRATKMEAAGVLLRRREGQPPKMFWTLAQQRQASSDTAVSTERVSTARPQHSRATEGKEKAVSDTHAELSLLVRQRPGETYEDWSDRIDAASTPRVRRVA
jgi:hypothetical protein